MYFQPIIKQNEPNKDNVTPTNVCQLSSLICANVKPRVGCVLSGTPGVFDEFDLNGAADNADAVIDLKIGTRFGILYFFA